MRFGSLVVRATQDEWETNALGMEARGTTYYLDIQTADGPGPIFKASREGPRISRRFYKDCEPIGAVPLPKAPDNIWHVLEGEIPEVFKLEAELA